MRIEKIYKIFGFTLIILAIIVAEYFLLLRNQDVNPPTVFTSPKNKEVMSFCNKDTDCVVVEGKSCCECPSAINNDYLDYWNSLEYEKCPDPAPNCAGCLSPKMWKPVCRNNKCELQQK